jgi:uncharacterized protein DUF2252
MTRSATVTRGSGAGLQAEGILESTLHYEDWLRAQTLVVERDLDRKHKAMRQSAFPFLRATYYAWVTSWPATLPALFDAPPVTAVGDLHIENFGTWRDAEGRLAWGVNDFDEASELPYTNDLVRLATSAALAYEAARLRTPGAKLSAAFLDGYITCLREGGRPVVFAESNRRLGERVVRDLLQPRTFWKELKPDKRGSRKVPDPARDVLAAAVPTGAAGMHVWPRVAGVGSLGRPRFVAVAEWMGGKVAREAKARVPSAAVWAGGGETAAGPSAFAHLLRASIRSRDPFLAVTDAWVVRRLAPDTGKIEICRLGRAREQALADLMGREVANVHLATPGAGKAILKDLERRPLHWLLEAARTMADLATASHEAWRKHGGR